MINLIIGRTSSGKDYVTNNTIKKYGKYGIKAVVSRTTRDKRGENDMSHIFVTDKEYQAEKNKAIAYTCIAGNHYYVIEEDLKDKCMYIIDPIGAKEIIKACPDIVFNIYHITCDEKLRHERYINRAIEGGLSKKDAEEEFIKRNKSEDNMFSEFECAASNKESLFKYFGYSRNLRICENITNLESPSALNDFMEVICNNFLLFNSISDIVKYSMEHDILNSSEDGKTTLYLNDGTVEHISVDNMTSIISTDKDGFCRLMRTYLIEKEKEKINE